jgi:hypothetical protein
MLAKKDKVPLKEMGISKEQLQESEFIWTGIDIQQYENDLFALHSSNKDLEDDEHQQWFKDICLPQQVITKEYSLPQETIDAINDTYVVFVNDQRHAIEKDEQVYCFYGRKSNRILLSNYGFALANNEFDTF